MDTVAKGHYYRKQLECKSRLIAWSHRSRFDMGLRLIGPSPRRLLDYGCGDGTFLGLAARRVEQGWGADITADQIDDCRQRLSEFSNLQFCAVSELNGPMHERSYDVVTCMETLEHCTDEIVQIVLRDLTRLVTEQGRVVISVPIEIGPTFLLKLVGRKLAAWRGLSDYKYYEPYGVRDALRMLFAGRRTHFDRPVYGSPGAHFHSHFGFNWKRLRTLVANHLVIEHTLYSPLGFLGGWVSSQAWFVCRPRLP